MMKLKRTSTVKVLKQGENSSIEKRRKSSSPKSKKSQQNSYGIQRNIPKQINSVFYKKGKETKLIKKHLESLRPSQIMIKVSYKGKKVSIPVNAIDDNGLHQLVMPQIVRFEHEVLKNNEFNQKSIEGWKTANKTDPLKDFYFQTNKPISVFKGQLLQIEPIWKQKIQNVNLSDFQIIKCIGTGGFSRVFLTKLKLNGKFYALKLVEKQGLFQCGKDCVVSNERDIMVGLNNQFLVNLEFAFETKHFVALVLEYCPGGQLFYYLRKVKRMNEDDARYCFLQILLGLQYLHTQKIIYRDIKPQNIMIDTNGNLKIADFGLSKACMKPNQLAYTYCGSPEYMAPEMLLKNGHTFALDYYCLGALLYELVTGNPPFYSRDVDKIYHSIQNQQIDFPHYIELSNEIKMFLECLLHKDPNRRLGSLNGIRQILSHPWLRKLNSFDILNKKITTPISINLLTFNVNQQEIQEMQENFMIKLNDKSQQFQPMFENFYFNRYETINIVQQIFPSVKSESTKQNKSLTAKYNIEKKPKVIRSAMSNERGQYLNIEIKNKQFANRKSSEIRKKIKPSKSPNSRQINNLIQRSKQRQKKNIGNFRQGINSKNTKLYLKKVKSSGLINICKNKPI